MVQREWGLRHFLIPRIIGVLWWLAVLFAFASILNIMLQYLIPWYLGRSMGNGTIYEMLKELSIPLGTLVVVRIFLESLSVVFSIHDRLTEILDVLEKNQTGCINPRAAETPVPPRTKPQLYS